MISYHDGDLLECGCEIIAHQVNLQGIMGGGIAKQIAEKYKGIEEYYQDFIKDYNEYCMGLPCGEIYVYTHCQEKPFTRIANCFSQDFNFNTNYEWVRKCFERLKEYAINKRLKTIGVPFGYGCGIANGDWDKVESIFEDIFENDKKVELQIWKKKMKGLRINKNKYEITREMNDALMTDNLDLSYDRTDAIYEQARIMSMEWKNDCEQVIFEQRELIDNLRNKLTQLKDLSKKICEEIIDNITYIEDSWDMKDFEKQIIEIQAKYEKKFEEEQC